MEGGPDETIVDADVPGAVEDSSALGGEDDGRHGGGEDGEKDGSAGPLG